VASFIPQTLAAVSVMALRTVWRSVGFEAINLTSEDVRWHGRSEKQVIKVIDQSPRYTLGVRYTF
jgi:hypothetical protein